MAWNSKKLYTGVLAVLCGASLLLFQNCAEQLDTGELDNSSKTEVDDLQILIPSSSIEVTKTLNLSATGGTPPYVFSVVSGPASITGSSTLQAGSSAGTAVVRVTDGAGDTSDGSVAIAPTTTASCTLPWGGTAPHGAMLVAYKAASPACGSPCESEARTCWNGVLSGTYTQQTCTAQTCYRWFNASNYTKTHSEVCQAAGYKVAADQGYGTCASGENRPVQGQQYDKINYRYGTYSGASKGGTTIVTTNFDGTKVHYCYKSGQKRDSDGTDLAVAYLCKK